MYKLSFLEKLVMSIFIFIRSFSIVHLKSLFHSKKVRPQISESYVLIWFVVLWLLLLNPSSSFWVPFLVTYRLIDGYNYRLCIVFVDRYNTRWGLRSLNRSLMLLLINYFEMIIGFATLYIYTESIAVGGKMPAIAGSWEAFYFSVVTITTLGYGDFSPINETGQFLVIMQTLMGIIFIILVVSIFLTGVSNIKNLEEEE